MFVIVPGMEMYNSLQINCLFIQSNNLPVSVDGIGKLASQLHVLPIVSSSKHPSASLWQSQTWKPWLLPGRISYVEAGFKLACVVNICLPLPILPEAIVDVLCSKRSQGAVIADLLLAIGGQLDQGDDLVHADLLLGKTIDVGDVLLITP